MYVSLMSSFRCDNVVMMEGKRVWRNGELTRWSLGTVQLRQCGNDGGQGELTRWSLGTVQLRQCGNDGGQESVEEW